MCSRSVSSSHTSMVLSGPRGSRLPYTCMVFLQLLGVTLTTRGFATLHHLPCSIDGSLSFFSSIDKAEHDYIAVLGNLPKEFLAPPPLVHFRGRQYNRRRLCLYWRRSS